MKLLNVIGIKIQKSTSKKILGLSQKAYNERVLERFKMTKVTDSIENRVRRMIYGESI